MMLQHHEKNFTKTSEMVRMTIEKRDLIIEVNNLKQRCTELSQENLFLKSEIADLRMTNVLLGGAL